MNRDFMKDSYEYAGSFPGGLLGCLAGVVAVQTGSGTPGQLCDGLQGCAGLWTTWLVLRISQRNYTRLWLRVLISVHFLEKC